MSAPTFVSLFTGAGGLDLGFVAAGFTPVFANDIAPDAIRTYREAMAMIAARRPDAEETPHRIVTGDIRTIENLPGLGAADVVIGGPPCQGFSVAGRMDPNDPRSRHVFDFMAVVARVRPKAFVMENVKALAVNRRWTGIISGLQEKAEELGYNTSLYVLNAAHYGVPQARERMMLIGVLDGEPMPCPEPTTLGNAPTVRSALEMLPPVGAPGNDQVCTARVTPAQQPVLRRSPWAGMLFNGQGRPLNLDAPAPTLPASMGGNRTPIVDQEHFDHNAEPWVPRYHAALWAGERPVKSVPARLRRITVDEAAVIQSFPMDMPWHGSQSSRYRQIGNAVPPKLALAVARRLGEHLGVGLVADPAMLESLTPSAGAAEAA